MSLIKQIQTEGHEKVIFSGELPAVIAIHSTVLGPSLGGLRFFPYKSETAAMTDALKLSKAMTFKAAAAGLDLGGGKAVIIGDPQSMKSEKWLRGFGRFVDSLKGAYITAEDVGTTVEDMDVIRQETSFVAGCSSGKSSGDPSPVTAYGVLKGIEACLHEVYGSGAVAGHTVAIQGVGKVGDALCGFLVDRGAEVIIADPDPERVAFVVSRDGVQTASIEEIHRLDVDVFSPCALGGIINNHSVTELRCRAVAGAANNQLLDLAHAKQLLEREIVYAPDFVINAGGLINVADELRGYVRRRAIKRVEGIRDVLQQIFRSAQEQGISTVEAALIQVKERLREAARSGPGRGTAA